MNATQPQKVGIMGGTFDPIHYGHLLIAQSAAEEFTLDQVLFLPTGKAPHKSYQHVTDPERRCDMVKLAISDNPKFKLSFLEVDHTEVNYTYLTLQKMKEQFNNSKFYFIMGEDSLDDFQIFSQSMDNLDSKLETSGRNLPFGCDSCRFEKCGQKQFGKEA